MKINRHVFIVAGMAASFLGVSYVQGATLKNKQMVIN